LGGKAVFTRISNDVFRKDELEILFIAAVVILVKAAF
ncbi:hypothetical protein LCGC14_3113160, partial [marine sediment metagenome]